MNREKFVAEMSAAIRDGIELKRTDDIGMAHLFQDRMEKCFSAAFDALQPDHPLKTLQEQAEKIRESEAKAPSNSS